MSTSTSSGKNDSVENSHVGYLAAVERLLASCPSVFKEEAHIDFLKNHFTAADEIGMVKFRDRLDCILNHSDFLDHQLLHCWN